MLTDPQGRVIRYLRLSLTPACPMSCMYCRPAAFGHKPGGVEITPDEIEAMVRHLVDTHGLYKIRLTGGEPTARHDFMEIAQRLGKIDGLNEITLTTNGLLLKHQAEQLKEIGINRVNVSLDSLDRARFEKITGIDGLPRVLEGLDAAAFAGLTPVRINTVVIRNHNDDELDSIVRYAAERCFEARFIELMPMGPLADVWGERFIPTTKMRERLNSIVRTWDPIKTGAEAAKRYHVTLKDGRAAVIGFISAMSCPFCEACDRIRIAADGTLYPCLMDHPAGTILPALRPKFDAEKFEELLHTGLEKKADEHPATGVTIMTKIGG